MATTHGTGRQHAHQHQPAGWLLFQHTDGRAVVAPAGHPMFDGDPGWVRQFPIEVVGGPAPEVQQDDADDLERQDLVLRASHGIEATVFAMRAYVESEEFLNEDPYVLKLALRGLWLRIKKLNSVIMSITGDDDLYRTSDGYEVVHGRQMPVTREAA